MSTKKKVKKASVQKSVSKIGVSPLGDRVLVRPFDETLLKSPGGIIIPDTARKEKPERGVVVAVGEGKRNEKGETLPMRISVGSTVVFSKYGFDEIEIDGQEYYIISENNILAVIK